MEQPQVHIVPVSTSTEPETADPALDIPEVINCTACNKSVKVKKKKLCSHPKLDVLLCKKCLKFISSNEFTKDDQGLEEYCTWCGDGGNLVCCDFCEKAYCKHCVKRNLGKDFLKTLLNADNDVKWKCFFCDKNQIITFIDECKAVVDYMKYLPDETIEESTPLPKTNEKSAPRPKTNEKSAPRPKTNEKSAPQPKTNEKSVVSKVITIDTEKTEKNVHAAPSGPSQSERRKRLNEMAKKVENDNSGRVGFKSSFPRYEISDDDEDVTPTPASTPTPYNNIQSIPTPDIKHENGLLNSNSSSRLKESVFKRDLSKDKTSQKEQNNELPAITNDDEYDSSISSGSRQSKRSNNEQKSKENDKMDTVKIDEENKKKKDFDKQSKKKNKKSKKNSESGEDDKEEDENTDTSAAVSKKKKKQTILMLSSSEDSEEEIVVMSKSGKRRVISKSIFLAAQAALDKGDKKSKSKTKEEKKQKSSSKIKSKKVSSSEEEDSFGSTESDNETLSQVKSKTISTKKPSSSLKTPTDEKEPAVDEPQPGPSGMRPKNKLQRSKLERPRQSMSSDSSGEDQSQNIGILSKKFRNDGSGSKTDAFSDTKRNKSRLSLDKDAARKRSLSEMSVETNKVAENLDGAIDKNVEEKTVKGNKDIIPTPETSTLSDKNLDKNLEVCNKDRQAKSTEDIVNFCLESVINKVLATEPSEISVTNECNDASTDFINKENQEGGNSIEFDVSNENLDSNNENDSSGETNAEVEEIGEGISNDKEELVASDSESKVDAEKAPQGDDLNFDEKNQAESVSDDNEKKESDNSKSDEAKIDDIEKINENEKKSDSGVAEDSESETENKKDKNKDDSSISERSKQNEKTKKTNDYVIDCISSDEETLSIKKNKKSDNASSLDSDNSSVDGKKSKRKCTMKSDKKAEEEDDKDSDSDSDIATPKKKKRVKRKAANSSDGDSESEEPKKTKKKGKKKKKLQKKKAKRIKLDDSDDEGVVSESSSSDGEEDDDDDVEMNDLESDSSSSDGSIIITRKSKRLDGNDKKKGKKGKKKKKDESDEESEEEDVNENTPSKERRKNIRRIMKDTELDEETLRARDEEEKRRKRLLERTKADRAEHTFTVEVVDGDFVLEKNDKKEPVVTIAAEINKHLKPHQRKGVQFVYDCVIETVASYKKSEGGGCLLAHCMGLGKTLQMVTFVHTAVHNQNIQMKRILVVCPLNTVLNWEVEFDKWIPDGEKIECYVLSYATSIKERVYMLADWFKKGGVCITGYEMYRNLVNGSHIKSKKMKTDVKTYLADPGPELVICDEGHILKNDATAISKAMNSIATRRRVVLTGTPLQNNLIEYHCMVSFVKPKLLGTVKEFKNRFVNPIHNGQCSNSTSYDVRIMKQRCHILYQLLAGCVQRQDYSVLMPYLPKKREYTIFVRLGETQIKMYEHYLEEFVYRDAGQKLKGSSLFADFMCLARIWTHPWALHIDRVRAAARNKYKSDDEFIDDEDDEESSASGGEKKVKPWTVDTSSDEDDDKRRKRRQKAMSGSSSDNSSSEEEEKLPETTQTRSGRNTRSRLVVDDVSNDKKKDKDGSDSDSDKVDETELPPKVQGSLRSGINFKDGTLNPERENERPEYQTEWFDKFITEEDQHNIELGAKLVLLHEILANSEAVGDKILVFSQSLVTLDLIEQSLAGGKIGDNVLNWCHGVDYFRMDGSTSVQTRKRWADIFNDPENPQCRLFLISTKAGSLGINMVAANRVIVFDCSWNPSHDVQSVFRVYRFGQEKPVYVYRFIAQGTMEEKIYGRQITKLATAGRVVDEMQIGRHFTDEEIRELYTFCPDKVDGSETPQLPKDPLLAEVLQRLHPKFIVRYHEHDLLLENVEGEELTEEERKVAWKTYEDEKDMATRRMEWANRPLPDVSQYGIPNMNFNPQPQHQPQFGQIRVASTQIPGLQGQRYTVTYPSDMTVEQRQKALLELRQRELMRLVQRNQPILPRDVDSPGGRLRPQFQPSNGTSNNGYRFIRLPQGTSINSLRASGVNISSVHPGSSYLQQPMNSTSHSNASSYTHTSNNQGNQISQKRGRPSHYNT